MFEDDARYRAEGLPDECNNTMIENLATYFK